MDDWRRVRLGDIAEEVTVGHVGSMASYYQPSGIPFLRSQNVLPHRLDVSDVKYIGPEFHAKLRKSALRAGDVVTVRTGKPGSTAVIPDQWDELNCSDLVITRPGSQINSRWLSYYINCAAEGFISSQLVGAVQQHFNIGSARDMMLVLPSLPEQRAIAEVLGALDDKIAANARFGRLAEALLAAECSALRMDQEPATEDSASRLTDLVELNPAVPKPIEDEPVYVDMQKLPVSGMSINDWSRRPSKGGARFQNGDTLLARITPCLENRKTGYVDFLADGQVAIGSTEYIVMRAHIGIPKELAYFIAISERFRAFAIRHMAGTSGRQRVSASDLAGYMLSTPDPAELEKFGRRSGPMFDLVKSQRDENRILANIRDSLLPQLMSGKIRVKDAEKEVEEVL